MEESWRSWLSGFTEMLWLLYIGPEVDVNRDLSGLLFGACASVNGDCMAII